MSELKNTQKTDESHENTLADLIGLEVYTVNGQYVGQVEDARIDFGAQKATGLALTEVNPDLITRKEKLSQSRGVIIPYRWVHSAGDVAIISNVFN